MTKRLKDCFLLLTAGLLLLPVTGWTQPGDARRGESIYVGSVGFAAGGAPCLACHGITGHELGYAAGASYGPDLTALFADYGEDGVAAVLQDPAGFESMAAIYADRPLSDSEIADLGAFFASVADQEKLDQGVGLASHAVLATVLLLVLFGALGWRRLQGVRKPLVEQARYEKGGLS